MLSNPSIKPAGYAPVRAQLPGRLVLFLCGAALGALRSVLRTSLVAIGHADRVERAAHHVIPNTRQILHTAAADEHDRVLLQVVADAGDVRRDLDTVRQAHASDLAQRRVRLLGGLRVHACANSTTLRRSLQRGG